SPAARRRTWSSPADRSTCSVSCGRCWPKTGRNLREADSVPFSAPPAEAGRARPRPSRTRSGRVSRHRTACSPRLRSDRARRRAALRVRTVARRRRPAPAPHPRRPPPGGTRCHAPRFSCSLPGLFADDLYQHPLAATAVEFAVEDPLPRPEVESPVGHGDDHFATHHLALEVGIGVVLAGPVVAVAPALRIGPRVERGELLEPALVVLVQPALVVVDEHRGGDVHGVDQAEPLPDAARRQRLFDQRRDVHERASSRDVEPQLLAPALHRLSPTISSSVSSNTRPSSAATAST